MTDEEAREIVNLYWDFTTDIILRLLELTERFCKEVKEDSRANDIRAVDGNKNTDRTRTVQVGTKEK